MEKQRRVCIRGRDGRPMWLTEEMRKTYNENRGKPTDPKKVEELSRLLKEDIEKIRIKQQSKNSSEKQGLTLPELK